MASDTGSERAVRNPHAAPGRTAAAAWSNRPAPFAIASAPVERREVHGGVGPGSASS